MKTRLRAFASLVERLNDKGPLYLQPFHFDTLVAYLSGYDLALSQSGHSSELDRFRDWLHIKAGHHCTLSWSAIIRDIFAQGDKERALPTFFALFREYRLGNPRQRAKTGRMEHISRGVKIQSPLKKVSQ